MLEETDDKKNLKSWSVPSLHVLPVATAGSNESEVPMQEAEFPYTYKYEFETRTLGRNYGAGLQLAEPVSADYTSGTDTSGSELGRKSPIFIESRNTSIDCSHERAWVGSEQEDEDAAVPVKLSSECGSCKSSDCIASEGFCVPDWSAAGEEYLEEVETSSEIKDEGDYSLDEEITPKFNLDLDKPPFAMSSDNSFMLLDGGSSENAELDLAKLDRPRTISPYYFEYKKQDFGKLDFLENECPPSLLCSSENSEITDRENMSIYRDSLEGSKVSIIESESDEQEIAIAIENVIGEALNITNVQRKYSDPDLQKEDVELNDEKLTNYDVVDSPCDDEQVDDVKQVSAQDADKVDDVKQVSVQDTDEVDVVEDCKAPESYLNADIDDDEVEEVEEKGSVEEITAEEITAEEITAEELPMAVSSMQDEDSDPNCIADPAPMPNVSYEKFSAESSSSTEEDVSSKTPTKTTQAADYQALELTNDSSRVTVNLERLQLQRKHSSSHLHDSDDELLYVTTPVSKKVSQEILSKKTDARAQEETLRLDSKSTLPSSCGNLSFSEGDHVNTSSSNISSHKDTSGNQSRSDIEEVCSVRIAMELLEGTSNSLPVTNNSNSHPKLREKTLVRPHSASTEIKSDSETQRLANVRRMRPHSASASHENVAPKSPMRVPPSVSTNSFTKQRSRSSKGGHSVVEKVNIEKQTEDYVSSMSKASPSAISDNMDEDSLTWSTESVNKYRSYAKMRKRELLARFIAERKHKEELDQLLAQLHDSYDKLLAKHAEAENTIDQLRLGKPLKTIDVARMSPQLYMHGSSAGPQIIHDIYKSPMSSAKPSESLLPSKSGSKESRYPTKRNQGSQANICPLCERCSTKTARDAVCQTDLYVVNDSFRSSVASLLLRANCLLEQVTSLHQCASEGIKIDASVGHQMCSYLWESLLALQRDLHSHSGHLASLEYFALEDTKCLLAKIQNQLLAIQSREPDNNGKKRTIPMVQVPEDFGMLESSKQILVKSQSSVESVPSPISHSKASATFDAVSIPDADSCNSSEKLLQTSPMEDVFCHTALDAVDARRLSSSSCFSGDTEKVESKSSNESECLHVVKTLLQAISSPSQELQNGLQGETSGSSSTDDFQQHNFTSNLPSNKVEALLTKPRSEDSIRVVMDEVDTNAVKSCSSAKDGLNVECGASNYILDSCFVGSGKPIEKLIESLSKENISPTNTDGETISPVSGKSNMYLAGQREDTSNGNTSSRECSLETEWNSLVDTIKDSTRADLNDAQVEVQPVERRATGIDQSGDRIHVEVRFGSPSVPNDLNRSSSSHVPDAVQNVTMKTSQESSCGQNDCSQASFPVCHQCHDRCICDCSGDTQHGNRLSIICDLLQEQLHSLQSSVMPNSIGNNVPSKDEVLTKLLDEVKLRLTRSWSNEKSNLDMDENPESVHSVQETTQSQIFSEETSHIVGDNSEKKYNPEILCRQSNNEFFDEFLLATDWGKIFGTCSMVGEDNHQQDVTCNTKNKITELKHDGQDLFSETSVDSTQEVFVEPVYFTPSVESLIMQAGQGHSTTQSVSTTYVYLAGDKESQDRNMLQELNEQIQQLRREITQIGFQGDNGKVCNCCNQGCQTEARKAMTTTVATDPEVRIMTSKASQVNMAAELAKATSHTACKSCGTIQCAESKTHTDCDNAHKPNKKVSDIVLHCCGSHHIVRKNSKIGIGEIQSEPNLKSPSLNCPYCKQKVENKAYHSSSSNYPLTCKCNNETALEMQRTEYKTDQSSLSSSDNISSDSNESHLKTHQIDNMINKSVKESVETFMENDGCRQELNKYRTRSYEKLTKGSKSEDATSCSVNPEKGSASMSKIQALIINNVEVNQSSNENIYAGTDDVSQLYNPEMKTETIDQQQSMQLSVAIPWSEDSGTSEDETETLTESLPESVHLYKPESCKFGEVKKQLSPNACEEQSWSSHHWQPSFGVSKDVVAKPLETHEEETEGENAGSQYSTCLNITSPNKSAETDASNQDPTKTFTKTKREGNLSSPETSSIAINDLVPTNSEIASENDSNDSDADSAVSTQSSELSRCSPVPIIDILQTFPPYQANANQSLEMTKIVHAQSHLDLFKGHATKDIDVQSSSKTLVDEAIDVCSSLDESVQPVSEKQVMHGSVSDSTLTSTGKPLGSENRSSASMTILEGSTDFANSNNNNDNHLCASISIQAAPTFHDADTQVQPSCRDIDTQMTGSSSRNNSQHEGAEVSTNSRDDNVSSITVPNSSINTSPSKMAMEMEDLEISDLLNPNSLSDSEVLNIPETKKFKSRCTDDLSNQSGTSSSHHKHSSGTDDQCSCKGCRKLVHKVDVITAMIKELTHRPPMFTDESTEEDTEEKKLQLVHALDLANKIAKKLQRRSVQILQSMDPQDE